MPRSLTKTAFIAVFAAVTLGGASIVHADVAEKIHRAFRGRILITDRALPAPAGGEGDVIKTYSKLARTELAHSVEDGVATWAFHFMAIMSQRPGVTQVSLDFYQADQGQQYVASKRLAGIDPKLKLLQSRVLLSEDDGLKRGGNYIVKLTADVRGKEVVLAQSNLKTN